jgi:hypothetical protein
MTRVALLRSAATSAIWSLSREKRTSDQADATSHFDPKRSFRSLGGADSLPIYFEMLPAEGGISDAACAGFRVV